MIFSQLKALLNKPHPYIFNKGSVVVPSLVTFLIILLFHPYGLANLPLAILGLFALGFGFIVAIAILLTVFTIKKIAPYWMDEEKWTVGKEMMLILIVLMLISVLMFLIFFYISVENTSAFQLFVQVVLKTILISIIPVVMMVLFEQYSHQRKRAKELAYLNKNLSSKEGIADVIHIKSEKGVSVFQIELNKILYLKSDGNYVDLFYRNKQGEIQKELIRNRLKNIEEQLNQEQFFKCHKSYLVNMDYLQKVEGNARNFEILLSYGKQAIPVSRTKSQELKDRLN